MKLVNRRLEARLAAAVLALALQAGPGAAADLRSYGAVSLGMGGAHVAVAEGAEALAGNPAALGVLPGWELSLPLFSAGLLQFNGLLASLSDIDDVLAGAPSFSALDAARRERLAGILGELAARPAGANVGVGAGVALKWQNFGFGVLTRTSGGVDATIDRERLGTADPGAADSITKNTSALDSASLTAVELRAGYAHSLLPEAVGQQLYAGGTLRLIHGATSAFHTELQDLAAEGSRRRPIFGGLGGGAWRMDMDLGLLYAFGTAARVGLVVRGLLDPGFEVEAPESYTGPERLSLGRQARLGAAVTPGAGFRLAADVDLTRNRTALSRVDERQLGLGLEKALGATVLRLGWMDNLSEPTGLTWTAGARWQKLDLALAFSPREGLLTTDQLVFAVSYRLDRVTKPPGY
jgi:hypothetical protein